MLIKPLVTRASLHIKSHADQFSKRHVKIIPNQTTEPGRRAVARQKKIGVPQGKR